MKTLSIIIFLSSIMIAQTIYEVTPGTKGNEIILTIENESGSTNAKNLQIRAIKSPEEIKFKSALVSIGEIEKENSKDIGLEFDVEREAKSGSRDTLVINISDENGSSWQKEIIVEYAKPDVYSLRQNYPNPFNPATKIEYQLPEEKRVVIKVYNAIGQEVTTLIDEVKPAGFYTEKFNASQYASGMYIYRMIAGDYVSIKKMMLIK